MRGSASRLMPIWGVVAENKAPVEADRPGIRRPMCQTYDELAGNLRKAAGANPLDVGFLVTLVPVFIAGLRLAHEGR